MLEVQTYLFAESMHVAQLAAFQVRRRIEGNSASVKKQAETKRVFDVAHQGFIMRKCKGMILPLCNILINSRVIPSVPQVCSHMMSSCHAAQ